MQLWRTHATVRTKVSPSTPQITPLSVFKEVERFSPFLKLKTIYRVEDTMIQLHFALKQQKSEAIAKGAGAAFIFFSWGRAPFFWEEKRMDMFLHKLIKLLFILNEYKTDWKSQVY